MSVLNTLKLSEKQRPTDLTPTSRLRLKLSDALDKQIAGAEYEGETNNVYDPMETRNVKNPETGKYEQKQVRVRFTRWWWTDETGKLFVSLRYGNRPVEIKTGKTAIEVGDKTKLADILKTLQTAIMAGELDKQLLTAAEARRAQFVKRKAKKIVA